MMVNFCDFNHQLPVTSSQFHDPFHSGIKYWISSILFKFQGCDKSAYDSLYLDGQIISMIVGMTRFKGHSKLRWIQRIQLRQPNEAHICPHHAVFKNMDGINTFNDVSIGAYVFKLDSRWDHAKYGMNCLLNNMVNLSQVNNKSVTALLHGLNLSRGQWYTTKSQERTPYQYMEVDGRPCRKYFHTTTKCHAKKSLIFFVRIGGDDGNY